MYGEIYFGDLLQKVLNNVLTLLLKPGILQVLYRHNLMTLIL